MTLGKLFIMKQSIIIYKVYKQDLVIWNLQKGSIIFLMKE